MKNFIKLLIFLPLLCRGAITQIGGAGNQTIATTPTSLAITYSTHTGNTEILVVTMGTGTPSVSSITDTGGSTWSFRIGLTGTSHRTELWSTGAGSAIASTSITVNFASATSASMALEEYSGVVALGITSTGGPTTSSNILISLVTQDNNNFIVSGLGAHAFTTMTATSGTIQQSGGITANSDFVEVNLCDNTVASPGSVSCGATFGSSPWTAVGLELRTSGGGGGGSLSTLLTLGVK